MAAVSLGYDQFSVAAVRSLRDSAALGTAISAGGTWAFLRAETQNIRWRDDGTDPTAAIGNLLTTTDPPLIYRGPLEDIRFIAATAGAVLHATIYKE